MTVFLPPNLAWYIAASARAVIEEMGSPGTAIVAPMLTSGDGFLAMFDGPQRAIRCAMSIRDAVKALGIQVRAGLHTGECEVRGDDIGGIGVHIGARVSALAGPNEVLVSSTLRDLVIGSGLEFEDRGTHELKGVPGEWHTFAVASA